MKLRVLTITAAGVMALGLAACQQKEEAAPAADAAPVDAAAEPAVEAPPADAAAPADAAPATDSMMAAPPATEPAK
ncbi:hypothetical protein [Phenylobacterium sp.]|uniref:hypothetical protein n=1 Tax=Phenylobacterium sp. TaxID=1871053 RepID=UPI00301BA38F